MGEILKAYKNMWRNTFDFKGRSTRKEYWIPVAIHAVLMILAALSLWVGIYLTYSFVVFWVCIAVTVVLCLYQVVALLPMVSLTVRRLRDGGKSAWWSVLLLFVGVGTVMVLFLCAGGSAFAFCVAANTPVALYGPPPIEYRPEENVPEEVYGPPPTESESIYDLYEQDKKYLEEASETEGEDALPQENTEENYSEVEAFIPEDNMNNVIYGPPEMFQ
ncbi:MAG: DUF805 domain-containing protein [Lachnospiraceae bacterium]|nr:DUF805 domain-containing protein [Lachnospiraceae bacterium]